MVQATVEESLKTGLERHRHGDLAGAESSYRQALNCDAANPDALHLLGVLAFQTSRRQMALDLIHRSISIRPAAEAYVNLGMVLAAEGQFEPAIDAYHRAIELHPS